MHFRFFSLIPLIGAVASAQPAEVDAGQPLAVEPAPAPAATPASASAPEPVADAGPATLADHAQFAVKIPTGAPDGGAVEIKGKLGEGLTVKAGELTVNLRGRVQVQGAAVIPGPGNTTTLRSNQIFVRRARLQLKTDVGHHLSLNLQLAFSPLDQEPDLPNVLRDYYIEWRRFRDVSVRLGQMKVPFDVQRVVSSSSLQFVDRSLVTGEFNVDRDMGLVLYSDDLLGWGKRLRYWLGVFGGDGRNRVASNVGLLYSARVTFAPFGFLDDKVEGDVDRESKFRLVAGVGLVHNQDTVRQRSTIGNVYRLGGFNYDHLTADVHVKVLGFSLLSEIYWRQANLDSKTGVVSGAQLTEYSRSGMGFFVQAGQYVLPWLELGVRYGHQFPTATTDPNFHQTREVGGVVGLFLAKHAAKLQTDYHYVDDGKGGQPRHTVRVQAQLYF